jgi:hypothetical protein
VSACTIPSGTFELKLIIPVPNLNPNKTQTFLHLSTSKHNQFVLI